MAGSVINLEKIWQEIGAWKKEEFRKAEFYQALPTPLLALALSLFDVGTDFNLAFQVPVECGSLDWNYTSGSGDKGMGEGKVEQPLRRLPSPTDSVPHLLCHFPLWSPHDTEGFAKIVS